MTLHSGARLGPYEIVDLLGKGGMGEVYRAHDTRLERDVALKVLPDHTQKDPELRSRFEREARVLSQLEHSHVCRLYDIGEENGSGYLVMELLQGETLRQRLDRGRMGMAEALETGAQVAEGLEAAHRHGLIHRDLKPGNVILTAEGAKILDFGLAKRFALGDAQETLLKQSGEPVSEQGSISGTVPYMSPEQVEGKTVDHRSDLFALGAVLYEMVAGQRAFSGDSAASVIAGILDSPPEGLAGIAIEGSQPVHWVLERLLSRSPEDRLQSAKDVALLLRREDDATEKGGRRGGKGILMGTAAAGLLLGAAGAALILSNTRSTDNTALPLPPERVRLEATGGEWLKSIALSPDGSEFAFSRRVDPEARVWHLFQQRLGTGAAALVSGFGNPSAPSFSPDGDSLAFVSYQVEESRPTVMVANRQDGSVARVIDSACWPRWSPDGAQIAFLRSPVGLSCEIQDPRISAAGGNELWLHQVDEDAERPLVADRYVLFPEWSPDSERLVFGSPTTANGGRMDLWTVDVATGVVEQLTDDSAVEGWPAWNPSDGRIYYSSDRGGTFNAWRIDPGRSEAEPELWTLPFGPLAQIAFSRDGSSALFATQRFERSIVRIPLVSGELQMERMQTLLGGEGEYTTPRLSPSGDRVALVQGLGSASAVLGLKLDDHQLTRLTNDEVHNRNPRWTATGNWVSYYSDRSGASAIWVVRPDGSGERLLDERYFGSSNHEWSPDGRWLYLLSAERTWRIPVTKRGDARKPPELGVEEQLPACPGQDVFWARSISADGRISGNCLNGRVAVHDPRDGSWVRSDHRASWSGAAWLDEDRLVLVTSDIEVFDADTLELVGRWPLGNQMISVLGMEASGGPEHGFIVTERSRVTSSLWSAELELGRSP